MTGIKTTTALSREDLKRIHQKQIFLLARGGNKPHADFLGISRAELTAQLGLSFPSVTALVDELLEKGVLEETGELESSDRGRPRKRLRAGYRPPQRGGGFPSGPDGLRFLQNHV